MNKPTASFLVLLGALSFAACDGDVVVEDGDTSSGASMTSSTGGTPTSSSSTSSSATGSNTTTSTGSGPSSSSSTGAGGAPNETCEKMKSITLSNVVLVDAGGDDVWSPGEDANLQVTMTNGSPDDNFDYPGFSVTSDVGGVTSTGNTLFGIFGSESTDVQFFATSDATTPKGTKVTLTLQVTTLAMACPDLDSIQASFMLE